jgi:glutathione peroxidase-family protein
MCGLTGSNYQQLEQLHERYHDKGLSILAFPCNQFGGQEPGTEAEIKDFVKKYNVTFEMFGKVNVNGEKAHPLYKFLKAKQSGLVSDEIKWNFSKFLVDKHGMPVKRYAPTTAPKDIEKDIIEMLAAE